MINIYKNTENGLINVNSIEDNCWINIVSPRYDELNRVSRVFGDVAEEFLTDPLDMDERPRIEIDEDKLLIIVRVPFLNKKHPESGYITVPFGIILLPKNIITVSSIELDILDTFLSNRTKDFSLENRKRFIILMLLEITKFYTKYLRSINNFIFQYENKFQKSLKNEELLQLMKIEKSLVYFTTSLKANELMISRLSVSKVFLDGLNEEDEDLLEDVGIEYRQNSDMTNISTNILSRTMYTFVSLISNKLNSTIKIFMTVLLSFVIGSLLLTFITYIIIKFFYLYNTSIVMCSLLVMCLSIISVFYIYKKIYKK